MELINEAIKQLTELHDELKQGDRLTDYKYVDFGRKGDVQVYTTPTGSSFSIVHAGVEISIMKHRNDFDMSIANKEAVKFVQSDDFWTDFVGEVKEIVGEESN